MAVVKAQVWEEAYEEERGKPMPSKNHGGIQWRIGGIFFERYADRFTLFSELTLDAEPPLVPDLSVYPVTELDWLHDEVQVSEPPLTAIEILSPSQSVNDLIPKIERYFELGVRSVWLVVPPLQQIALFTPEMEPQIFSSDEMVDTTLDVRVPLDEIFV